MKPFPDSEDDEDTPTTGRPGTCRQELDEIERLLQPDHPTARQDALQAACFVGREWLADEVDAWLRDENAPWAMLVTGSPGCGKSAFAAHELMHDDRVGAAVFCQHDGAAFDNLESVSRSVAFQLSARFPDYRSALLGVLRREEEHRGRGDEPRDGGPFERYVTSVSRNLIAGGRDEIVIIIDGLDEVAGERSGPGAVNPLAEELGRLLDEGRVPRHVRLLVTSRADAAAVGPLTAARRLDVDKFAREGEADVRTYVEARVGREDPHREEIVRRAGANFLYARVACDLADGGAFDAGAVLKGLGVLYHQYLDRAFGRPRGKLEGPAGTPGVTRDALCLVASMGEPVPCETLRRAMKWSERDEGDFRRALGMYLSETPDGRVSLFHKSFSDWLWTDEALEYQCDPGEGRELALGACLASFREDAGGMSRFEAANLLPLLRESGETHADDLREALGSEGLAGRLAELSGEGQSWERIRCLEGALSIHRSLAEEDPVTWLPEVAASCRNLGRLYFDDFGAELPEVAEDLYREALETYRSLEATNPGTWLPGVAWTCDDLAELFADANRYDEAESLYREALRIRRSLAEGDPGTHLPDVARSCIDLAELLIWTDRPEEVERLYREALGDYRSLAEEDPWAWLPYVAGSCDDLAEHLIWADRPGEAEQLYREALDALRSLAEEEPQTWLPDVAGSCNNLAKLLDKADLYDEAKGLYREALGTYRSLAEEDPGAWLSDVACACDDLARVLTKTGRSEEAEGLYREALEIRRSLAEEEPGAWLPYVAGSCGDLAKLLDKAGRYDEAEGLYREALGIRRSLTEKDPGDCLPGLAWACDDLAKLLSDNGRYDEAEGLYREALGIYRSLAEKEPGACLSSVSCACNNLAVLLDKAGRYEEAEPLYRETLGIRRSLEEDKHGARLPGVACACNNLAVLLAEAGRFGEAEPLFRETLGIRRALAEKDPGAWLPGVAWACNNLAVLLDKAGRYEEAESLLREALEKWRSLPEDQLGAWRGYMAQTCGNLASLLSKTGRPEEAEGLYQEAMDVYTDLQREQPGRWNSEIEWLRNALG